MGKRFVLILAVGAVLALGVYFLVFGWPGGRDAPEVAIAAPPPPPKVGIVVVRSAEVPLPVEYAGRVRP